ncbi:GIY-YIG nuclease family protein [Rhizobium leguminosarum]
MPEFRNIPELVMVKNRWELEGFNPSMPAWNYEEFAGRTGTLYVLELQLYCKIGMSRDFEKRLRQINCVMPVEARAAATRTVPLSGMAMAEAWMHRQFKPHAVKNEWFLMPHVEALEALPRAVTLAKVYDRYCRTHHLEKRAERAQPHVRARLQREYHEFMVRQMETISPD